MWDLLGERYGFKPWDISRLHPDEVNLYLKGAEIREERKSRNSSPNRQTAVSADQQRREREAIEKYA